MASHETFLGVLGGEAHAKSVNGKLCALICDVDSTSLFLMLDAAQRTSTLAFAWSVGNNSREMITVVLKGRLEVLAVEMKLYSGVFPT